MTGLDTRETGVDINKGQHIEMSPFGALYVFPVVPDIEAMRRRIRAEHEASQPVPLTELAKCQYLGQTVLNRENLQKHLLSLLQRQEDKIQYSIRNGGGLETRDYLAIPTLGNWIESPLLAPS